jgi:D-alanine-D-alanine ligase
MKIKLAVIFGGKSTEHEISIISALQAMQNLDTEKYEILPLYLTKNNEFYYGDDLKNIEEFKDIPVLLKKIKKVSLSVSDNRTLILPFQKKLFSQKAINYIDTVLLITHGTNVEDGGLQGFLENINLPYTSPDVRSSAVCMDKYIMKILLKEGNFPVLDGIRIKENEFLSDEKNVIKKVCEKFSYPVIVKPVNLGSSIGINKANSDDELFLAFNEAFSFAEQVIIEPLITDLKEVNCAVIGDKDEFLISEVEEVIATEEILSYEDKYSRGNNKGEKISENQNRIIPAKLTKEKTAEIKKIAGQAFSYLDLFGVTRIDFMIDKKSDKLYINELNTIPGSLSFYLFEPAGIPYKILLDKLIALSFKRKRDRENTVYSFDTNILSMKTLSRGKAKV